MIYVHVDPASPIQQGDIFRYVPRIEMSLSRIPVIDGLDTRQTSWQELLRTLRAARPQEEPRPVSVILAIKPVLAVAITQNCDAARARDICLCQVDKFLEVAGRRDVPQNDKKWQSLIVSTMRQNPKLFYLPAAPDFGIADRMAADFRIIFRVPREDLETMRSEHRIARLNGVATEHFRESLAFFFRRYAFNEWYALTNGELQAYQDGRDEAIQPYPWQAQHLRESEQTG